MYFVLGKNEATDVVCWKKVGDEWYPKNKYGDKPKQCSDDPVNNNVMFGFILESFEDNDGSKMVDEYQFETLPVWPKIAVNDKIVVLFKRENDLGTVYDMREQAFRDGIYCFDSWVNKSKCGEELTGDLRERWLRFFGVNSD